MPYGWCEGIQLGGGQGARWMRGGRKKTRYTSQLIGSMAVQRIVKVKSDGLRRDSDVNHPAEQQMRTMRGEKKSTSVQLSQ